MSRQVGSREDEGYRELIPQSHFSPKEIPVKLFLDHFWFRKSEGLKIDNPISKNINR